MSRLSKFVLLFFVNSSRISQSVSIEYFNQTGSHDCENMTTGEQIYIWTNVVGDTDFAVFTALEGYGIKDDTDVLGDTAFYDMSFRNSDSNTVDIEWDYWIMSGRPLTGLEVETPSDERVKLHSTN